MSLTNTKTEVRIPISVWRDGQAWGGWYVLHGREVEVFSAYGSGREKLGRRSVQRVAESLLADAVQAWRSSQR